MDFRLRDNISDFLSHHGAIIYPITAFYTAPGTWHPHIYETPPKRPTPFLISNILEEFNSDCKDGGEMKCENQFRNHPNGQFYTREMYSPERPKFSDHKSTGSSNSHSPCNFMRDRVESPINGTVCCFIKKKKKKKKNNNRVAWVPV